MYLLRVIRKVTLSFTPYLLCFRPPYPLFQWYPQSKEILLNLGMLNDETQQLMHKVRE
jgi:hypothetical protein